MTSEAAATTSTTTTSTPETTAYGPCDAVRGLKSTADAVETVFRDLASAPWSVPDGTAGERRAWRRLAMSSFTVSLDTALEPYGAIRLTILRNRGIDPVAMDALADFAIYNSQNLAALAWVTAQFQDDFMEINHSPTRNEMDDRMVSTASESRWNDIMAATEQLDPELVVAIYTECGVRL